MSNYDYGKIEYRQMINSVTMVFMAWVYSQEEGVIEADQIEEIEYMTDFIVSVSSDIVGTFNAYTTDPEFYNLWLNEDGNMIADKSTIRNMVFDIYKQAVPAVFALGDEVPLEDRLDNLLGYSSAVVKRFLELENEPEFYSGYESE